MLFCDNQKNLCLLIAIVLASSLLTMHTYASEDSIEKNDVITIHVSPEGNNTWTGRTASPDESGNGPLASLAGARDAVRNLIQSETITSDIHVLFAPGTYEVTEPTVFSPEDTAPEGYTISYAGTLEDDVLFHGGKVIESWEQDGHLWVADIPEVRNGAWNFSALWVNGERRTLARIPNPANDLGDYPVESDCFGITSQVMETHPETGEEQASRTAIRFNPEDIQPWESIDDALVVVYHSWETSAHRIAEIDWENSIFHFTGPASWPFRRWPWGPHQRYYIENLFEALDSPGEWYLNTKTGKLYYWPMPGEQLDAVEIVAPIVSQFILLEGIPEEEAFVSNLIFKNLQFKYSEFAIAPEGHSDAQAAYSVGAAIEAIGARNCHILQCEVGHVGTYGVWWRRGSQNNSIEQTYLHDLGAGGIRVGEIASPSSPPEAADHNRIVNNLIQDGGRIFRSAVGVWIGRASYNEVLNNQIGHMRYTGISVGWSWGYAPSSAHHNIIAYNHIHDIGKGQLNDMGGIYTLGLSPGTELRNNLIHHVICNEHGIGGWGIYPDEGTTDMLIRDNVVFYTRTGGFHQHYGKENRVKNNIFAFSEGPQIIRSLEEDHVSFFIEGNIVLFDNGQLLGWNWNNKNFQLDNNIYWDIHETPIDFAGRSFDAWQEEGQDQHSHIVDPEFIRIDTPYLELKEDSPAISLIGFEPIDLDIVGLQGDNDWVSKGRQLINSSYPLPTKI